MRYLLASAIFLATASAAFGEMYAPAIYRPIEVSQNDTKPIISLQHAPRVEMVPPSDTLTQVAPPAPTDADSVRKSLMWMNF